MNGALQVQKTSALYLDQPFERQLRLLELAFPGLKNAGVPLGPSSKGFLGNLQQASMESGIVVNTAFIGGGSELLSVLSELAEISQAFILLPDPEVSQRGTVQSFFCTPIDCASRCWPIPRRWCKAEHCLVFMPHLNNLVRKPRTG